MSDAQINPDLLSDEDLPVDFGRYTLTRVLGEGGMARVFLGNLAGPQGFKKPCAIKVLHSSVARRGEKFLLTLSNEARLGGLLNHPNVVNTYDFGNVDGQPFIAMEFIDGLGIDVLLEQVQRPPIAITLQLAIQMCAGLDYAHNIEVDGRPGNLVHRDLKPSNVIVSRNGVVKVMDFGIAKASNLTAALTGMGMTKGTPPFMSPEQMAAEDLDRRSDIFAMGSLLYEVATGERLFSETSVPAVISAVMNVDRTLRDTGRLERLDSIFPELKPILVRCLHDDRDARYPTARALANDLKRILRSLPPADNLEDYVQAVILGEVLPATADVDFTAPTAEQTADLATPVEQLPAQTEQIVFVDSEPDFPDQGTAHQGQSSTTVVDMESDPVMVTAAEEFRADQVAEEDDEHATAVAATPLKRSPVSQQRPSTGRPRTGTQERRRRERKSKRAPALVFLLGLLLLSLLAFTVNLVRSQGEDPNSVPSEGVEGTGPTAVPVPSLETTEPRPRGRQTNGKSSQSKASTSAREATRGSASTAVPRSAKRRATGEAAATTSSEPSSDRREDRRAQAADSTPNPAVDEAPEGATAQQSEDRSSQTDDATTPAAQNGEPGARRLKLETAPKEFFAGRRAKFRVAMPDHQSGERFNVTMRLQCRGDAGRWRRYALPQVARNAWELPVLFENEDRGICKYWFEAAPQGKTASSLGNSRLRSKQNAYTLTIR